jgi:hypothetical protein
MGHVIEGIIILLSFVFGVLGFKTTAIVLMLFAIYEIIYDIRKNGISK